jgi:hypothetical protein
MPEKKEMPEIIRLGYADLASRRSRKALEKMRKIEEEKERAKAEWERKAREYEKANKML